MEKEAKKKTPTVPAQVERTLVRQMCERALDGDRNAQDCVFVYILQQGEQQCAATQQ